MIGRRAREKRGLRPTKGSQRFEILQVLSDDSLRHDSSYEGPLTPLPQFAQTFFAKHWDRSIC
jgi:hypothetical protein